MAKKREEKKIFCFKEQHVFSKELLNFFVVRFKVKKYEQKAWIQIQ
jgi:hypothetical protein